MNDRGITIFLWLIAWPILILMWLFPQTEEEAKRSKAKGDARRTAVLDSLLFEEKRRRF